MKLKITAGFERNKTGMSSVKSGKSSMVLRSCCDGKTCNKTGHGHAHHVHHSGSFLESQKVQKSKQATKSEKKTLQKTIESQEQVSNTVKSIKRKTFIYSDSEHKASTIETRETNILDKSGFDILAASSTSTPRQFSVEYVRGLAKKYFSGYFNEKRPKTDYTYSRTATYLSYSDSEESYESPNMSRRSLRNNNNGQSFVSKEDTFSEGYSSHDGTYGYNHSSHSSNQNTHSSSYASNLAVASQVASHIKTSSALKSNLSSDEYTNYMNHYIEGYGLDHTSDVSDTEFSDHGSIEAASFKHKKRKKNVCTSSMLDTFWSFLRRMAETIVFTWLWRMIVFLWTISSGIFMFDYWVMARNNAARRPFKTCCIPLFIPLLLILSILGLSYLQENGFKEVVPWIGPFLIANKTESIREKISKDNSQVNKNDLMTDEMKQYILKLYQDQHYYMSNEDQLRKDQVESIVRNVIQEELNAYSKKEELIKTEVHIKQLALEKELELAKEKIQMLYASPNAETLSHIKHLEDMITSLKDDVKRLEHVQEVMILDVKRCCNNETSLLANIQKHLNETIIQMVNDNRDLTKMEFSGLNNWVESHFVANHELDSKLSAVISEVTSKVAAVEKAAVEKAAIDKAASEKALREKSSTIIYASSQNNTHYSLHEHQIREIVKEALRKYSADKIGMVDYALESAGGSVLSTKCSETYHTRSALMSLFGIPLFRRSNSPRTAIQPEVYPGQCWAFKGAQGYIVIQLSGVVKPTAFSLEHIPKSLSPTGNIDSAPRNFTVYGLKFENAVDAILLGTYSYDQDGEPLQYFPVQNSDAGSFPIVELRINSNHGNMEYTCLYRFRVHGILEK